MLVPQEAFSWAVTFNIDLSLAWSTCRNSSRATWRDCGISWLRCTGAADCIPGRERPWHRIHQDNTNTGKQLWCLCSGLSLSRIWRGHETMAGIFSLGMKDCTHNKCMAGWFISVSNFLLANGFLQWSLGYRHIPSKSSYRKLSHIDIYWH